MPGVYHPGLGLIYGVTVYDEFHEWAHVWQHARGSIVWRVGRMIRTMPLLGRLGMIAIESEASVVALWTLWRCRALEFTDLWEAAIGLLQALTCIFSVDNEGFRSRKRNQAPHADAP